MSCSFTVEQITGVGKVISGDGCVSISFTVDRGCVIAGATIDGSPFVEGTTTLQVPPGYPDERIFQSFRVSIPPGGGLVCQVIKTFIH